MAAQELGGAVENKIGAELERTLIDGRGECVVNHHQRPMTMCCRGEPRDIEWAWAEGRFWLLQARPITTTGAAELEQVRREEIAALATVLPRNPP